MENQLALRDHSDIQVELAIPKLWLYSLLVSTIMSLAFWAADMVGMQVIFGSISMAIFLNIAKRTQGLILTKVMSNDSAEVVMSILNKIK